MAKKKQKKHKKIGEVIKAARVKLSLPADAVGVCCNVSRSRVYQWEAADYIMPKNLKPLSAALHIPIERLERANRAS